MAKTGIASRMRAGICLLAAFLLATCMVPFAPSAEAANGPAGASPTVKGQLIAQASSDIEAIVNSMSMDEKISQMIVPAMRTWDGKSVTRLADAPDLAAALQKHKYGGVILYASNVSSSEQVTRLTTDLQKNNAVKSSVPYLMCVDGEGGVVVRLTMGTRMNGGMAVGATGAAAADNARATGTVIGEEVAAAGFNVDFAPDIDVNSNAANPVIGVRAFSDDANTVARLGNEFAKGLSASNVVATYKHFPGHGDTSTDTHIAVASVNKTYDELKACELIPFKSAIANGADLIMTAHITLPLIDDEVTFADGTKGFFPATMSKKVLNGILRGDMGYEGVIVTDGLEMDALYKRQLVPGGPAGQTNEDTEARRESAEYGANLAVKIIESGSDILLSPTDLNSSKAAQYYDDYIAALVDYANGNPEFAARVNESVTRIMNLKAKYGILDMDTSGSDIEQKVARANATIGSQAHHATEADIARQAVTLLKNSNYTLPFSGHKGNVVLVGRNSDDVKTILYAVGQMQASGLIDSDARVVNLSAGTATGSAEADMTVTIDYYRDFDKVESLHYTEQLQEAIAQADSVAAFTATWDISALQPTAVQNQGITRIMADARAAGATFTLMSNNLPYDTARYQDADAILCAYMSSGLNMDPTDRGSSGNMGAYNANVVCALEMLFDAAAPAGTLPVRIPKVKVNDDGTAAYSDETLYARGDGLRAFAYAFVIGAGGVHEQGAESGLHFEANARHDKLVSVRVDGTELVAADFVVSAGSTNVDLGAAYLDTLAAGKHQLDAVYDYGSGPFAVSTTFEVKAKAAPTPTPTPSPDSDSGSGSNSGSNSSGRKASASSAPKTGDVLPMAGIVAVAVAGCCAIALVLVARKKRER